MSPGVILANSETPMINVTFENVVVNNPTKSIFQKGDKYYSCENV